MDKKVLFQCIDFFRNLEVSEEDVTSESEKANGQLAVIASYKFHDKQYFTSKLYYREIRKQAHVKNPDSLSKFFGGPVFWLDNGIHDWPEGKGAKLERTVIPQMAENSENQAEFIDFLKSIANDRKTGFEQLLTKEGRSALYSINLENNNHWHDIIRFIQKAIQTHGLGVSRNDYSRLVFEWDNGERTSLHPNFGSRLLVKRFFENILSIKNTLEMQDLKNLLEVKKQIILQGPPGTGKTRLAKHLASQLIELSNTISEADLKQVLSPGQEINSPSGRNSFTILSIEGNKVKLKPKEATLDYSVSFEDIIDCISKGGHEKPVTESDTKGTATYKVGLAKFVVGKLNDDRINLIQFHPSYTYEDFVRGIIAENQGDKINYKTKDRILAEFAKKALTNYLSTNEGSNPDENHKVRWIEDKLADFLEDLNVKLESNAKIELSPSAYILGIESDCIRYSGDNWGHSTRINLPDFKKIINYNLEKQTTLIPIELSNHGFRRITYYKAALEMFYKYSGTFDPSKINVEPLKNFVLIIDEINRANLPSVLGELIYALEYRGQPVESLYELEGKGRQIILPPNLFIIGTMNTADRSVGHIDYAIRRRFAFVDVLPSTDPIKSFAIPYFKSVSELFINNFDTIDWANPKPERSDYLASDFSPEDIWIGHSYFITEKDGEAGLKELKIKLQYEVIPLLKEYVKDGILNKSAEAEIQKLSA